MTTVGAYEAKTHLSKLLDRVARGEHITIARHGVPIAVLQPVHPAREEQLTVVISRIEQFRKGRRLGGMSIRAMIEEGRT